MPLEISLKVAASRDTTASEGAPVGAELLASRVTEGPRREILRVFLDGEVMPHAALDELFDLLIAPQAHRNWNTGSLVGERVEKELGDWTLENFARLEDGAAGADHPAIDVKLDLVLPRGSREERAFFRLVVLDSLTFTDVAIWCAADRDAGREPFDESPFGEDSIFIQYFKALVHECAVERRPELTRVLRKGPRHLPGRLPQALRGDHGRRDARMLALDLWGQERRHHGVVEAAMPCRAIRDGL